MTCDVHLVASGPAWIGYGVRSFSSIIHEMIDSARNELAMTVYVISDPGTVKDIKRALERGVLVEIFIYLPDTSSAGNATKRLLQLERRYSNLTLTEIRDEILHSKVVVSDSESVLIGSANPTFRGLFRNYELGLLIRDVGIAQKILLLLRRLRKKESGR